MRLAQKWEKSDNPEDKSRAQALRAALKLIDEKGVEKMFKELVEGLGQKNMTGGDFNTLLGKDKKLMDALTEILALLETEDELTRLKIEIEKLKQAIEAVKKLKTDQENIRGRNDNPKSDAEKLTKDQRDLANQAPRTSRRRSIRTTPTTRATRTRAPRSQTRSPRRRPKPSPATIAAKPSPTPRKTSPVRRPTAWGCQWPATRSRAPRWPECQPAATSPPRRRAWTRRTGEPKPSGEPKPMPGGPMDPKPGDSKPMSGDSKSQGSGKGDSKPSDSKAGGEGKPMGGEGKPMDGMGQPSPGDSKPGGSPPPGGQQPNKPKDPAAQEVQQAVPQQQGAEDDIKKGKPERSVEEARRGH